MSSLTTPQQNGHVEMTTATLNALRDLSARRKQDVREVFANAIWTTLVIDGTYASRGELFVEHPANGTIQRIDKDGFIRFVEPGNEDVTSVDLGLSTAQQHDFEVKAHSLQSATSAAAWIVGVQRAVDALAENGFHIAVRFPSYKGDLRRLLFDQPDSQTPSQSALERAARAQAILGLNGDGRD